MIVPGCRVRTGDMRYFRGLFCLPRLATAQIRRRREACGYTFAINTGALAVNLNRRQGSTGVGKDRTPTKKPRVKDLEEYRFGDAVLVGLLRFQ